MRKLITLTCFILLGFSWVGSAAATLLFSPLETVDNLDQDRYLGKWYQIAAIPMWFQRQCVSDTFAEYDLDGSFIKVKNSCRKKDGTFSKAYGFARMNPKYKQSSKLQVSFFNPLGCKLWFFSGDYWVIDLDEDYSISLVGSPDRKYFWILSRVPVLDSEQLIEIKKKIEIQGFDSCLVKITQEGELENKKLCQLVSEV